MKESKQFAVIVDNDTYAIDVTLDVTKCTSSTGATNLSSSKIAVVGDVTLDVDNVVFHTALVMEAKPSHVPTAPATTLTKGPSDLRVRVKGASTSFPLAYVDPNVSRNGYPGGRGPGELCFYTVQGMATVNEYGWSIPVDQEGIVTDEGSNWPCIPTKGGILSGHDGLNVEGRNAAQFLRDIRKGATLEFFHPAASTSSTQPRRVLGAYVMDGTGRVSDLPPECNRIMVAFYQGTGLVEWGGDDQAAGARAFASWRGQKSPSESGRDLLVSLGGAGGHVDLDKIPEGITAINSMFRVDGIDFDNEAFEISSQQALQIAKDTADALRRPYRDFIVQFVPPGGPPVAKALAAAVVCQQAGFQVYFGQQLYETSITDDDVMNATQLAVTALDAQSVLVGVMLNDSHESWTPTSTQRRLAAVKAKWPTIGGVYFWESARPNTRETLTAAASILK